MSADVVINNNEPGVQYEGTEANAIYYEDREVAGVMYRTQNAQYSKTLSQWSLVDNTKPAFATVQSNKDGHSISYYMPAGSGPWTSWSVSEQGSVYNVRDFGAVGDGVTDDQAAINAANAAAVAAGGGYIYLPAGTYLISKAILLGSASTADVPITMGGDGAEFTTILAGTLSGGTGAIMVANVQWNNTSTTYVQRNIYVEKLRFDCNGAENSGAQGPIYLKQVQNCGVRDCEIFNSSTHGILIYGSEAPASWPGNSLNFQILRNHINLNYQSENPSAYPGVYPIRALGASIGIIQGNTIGDLCTVSTNDAIDFPGSSDVTCCDNYVTMCGDGMGSNACNNVTFANNRIYGAGGFGISTFASGGEGNVGVSNVIVTGNVIVNVAKSGIRIASQNTNPVPRDFAVTGNVVVFDAASVGPTGIHIEASYGCVTGNTIDLGGTSNNGISIDSSEGEAFGNAAVTVTGNTINNGGTGSSGIIFNNLIGPPPSLSINCVVTGNSVFNVSQPLSTNWDAMDNCVVRSNPGINPWGTNSIVAPVVTTSAVFNPYPFDIWVAIVGGAVTSVSINGNVTGIKNGSVLLPAGSNTIKLTYTTAPTWTWLAY